MIKWRKMYLMWLDSVLMIKMDLIINALKAPANYVSQVDGGWLVNALWLEQAYNTVS